MPSSFDLTLNDNLSIHEYEEMALKCNKIKHIIENRDFFNFNLSAGLEILFVE